MFSVFAEDLYSVDLQFTEVCWAYYIQEAKYKPELGCTG